LKKSIAVHWRGMKKHWEFYLLVIPAVLYIIIFKYIPLVGMQIAFRDFKARAGFWGSEWVGLDHFKRFMSSPQFWEILYNTIEISAVTLFFTFPAPIILALLLNEVRFKALKKVSQTITLAPHFISVVVVVGMLVAFLDPLTGIVNHAITALGGKPVDFLTEAKWFRHLFVWSGTWQQLGWSSIIYMAALAGVNPELHEAAEIDGASRLQRILYINIPAILPTIIILLILNFGSFMTVGFEKVLLMQNELNASTSDVIQTFVYQTGLIRGEMDYSAAIGLFDSLINITLIITMNWVAKKTTENSLW